MITSSNKVMVFGTFHRGDTTTINKPNDWSTIVCASSVNPAAAINGANNTQLFAVDFPGVSLLGSTLTATPAAISVQVMNPTSLMSAGGLFYGAVCHTQLKLGGRVETWNDFVSEFLSYMRPRLMSGGKLALRGVHADSYPLNMATLADFTAISASASGTNASWTSDAFGPSGFAPVVFVNDSGTPLADPLPLNYLVTVEWRVRFDIGNPAVASHRHHGITSDNAWDTMVRTASSLGNGIRDIADVVASAGQAAASVRSALGGRQLPMLVD
jgi:hypothetical protein